MRFLRLLPVICLAAAGVAAHADTITTFAFSNTTVLENKGSPKVDGTVSGTVTIDVTNPNAISNWSSSFSAVVAGAATYNYSGSPTSVTAMNNSGTSYYKAIFTPVSVTGSGVAGTTFILDFTDAGGTITLCDRNTAGGGQACGTSVNSYLNTTPANEDVISGTLNVVTPEPSSLMLLGTGLVSLAGVARRRFMKV